MNFSEYSLETGIFTSQQVSGFAQAPAATDTHAWIEGHWNPGAHKVDTGTGQVVPYQPPAPASDAMRDWVWDELTRRWMEVPTLAATIISLNNSIDMAAGRARLRYITEVPGQQAVYLRKYEQAQQYAGAGYTGTVPPYVAGEAAANNVSAQVAADTILAIANAWDNMISPTIESQRIGGKRAVEAATDIESANAAAMAAIAALDAI